MTRTIAKAVETWDLNEVLAVLSQVAQDAADAERAPQAAEGAPVARVPPAADEGGRRT